MKTTLPARIASVNRRVWLERLRDGTVRIVAGGGIRVWEPVDAGALSAALKRLTEGDLK